MYGAARGEARTGGQSMTNDEIRMANQIRTTKYE
jgi:hypothetical protein